MNLITKYLNVLTLVGLIAAGSVWFTTSKVETEHNKAKIDKLESSYDLVSSKLDRMNQRLSNLEGKIDLIITKIGQRRDRGR